MSKGKKILLIIFCAILLIFAIFASLGLWLASAVFDQTPSVAYTPHEPDTTIMLGVIQKLSGDDQEKDILKTMLGGQPSRLSLSEIEVNEIIKSGIETQISGGNDGKKKEALKNLDIKFSNGIFSAKYSFAPGIKTPFGRYINFKAEFVPKIADRHIQIEVKTLAAGSISLPQSKIDYLNKAIADQIAAAEEADPNVSDFLDAVTETKIEGSQLIVEYQPLAIMKTIMEKGGQGLPFPE
jgi:hypothetical protein